MKQKWMLVALALLALVALSLVGCKNDSVSEPVKYTITFNTDGGSTVQSQTIVSGQKVPEPAEPTKNDYVFVGWYSDEEFTNKYDFTTPVTSSFTLYAKWGIGITSATVASVIEGLSEGGPYTLVATGEWTDGFSTLAEALKKDGSKKVNLDLSGVERLETIGKWAFYECSSLTDINLPSGLTTIGGGAFGRCSSLTSINIPASVTSIGDGAFGGCSSLTSINIPASVTSIGDGAFSGCSSLNISVNENNTTYSSEDGMLLNKEKTILIAYPSAKGTVTNVPASVTSIGDYAFVDCSSLTSISLLSSVTSIGDYAFSSCISLTSITIPSSVTTIGYYAFIDCSSLTSITIPSSVTTIGERAFGECISLTTVTMEATEPPTLGEDAFFLTAASLQIRVPEGSETKYKTAESWTTYSNKIPEQPS